MMKRFHAWTHFSVHFQTVAYYWRIFLVLSACIHYAGVIFYAIFASGELQPWADPKLEEEKQWNQLNETYSVRKKSIVSFRQSSQHHTDLQISPQTSNGLMQRQLSGKASYGSVDTPLPPRGPAPPGRTPSEDNTQQPSVVPSSNPFVSTATNPFRQEAVQPQAQDSYMHGTIEDRAY